MKKILFSVLLGMIILSSLVLAAGSTGSITHKKTQTWTKITPGVAAIMKIADPELGFKQISITVKNQANTVSITVTKLDSKPASVIHEITGNVYKYTEINATKINETDIDNVKIQFEVNKSWINENNIDPDTVALNRYHNDAWEKLSTKKTSEDNNYIYYEAETTGFSTFAITGEVKTETTTVSVTTTPELTTTLSLFTTTVPLIVDHVPYFGVIFIVIVIIIILAIIGFFLRKKRKVIQPQDVKV